MAKKSKDVELDYLNELGIQPAKNMQEVRVGMISAVGEDTAKAIWRQLHRQKPCGGAELEELYALTDESLEASLALTGAIDGDIYRKICRWVAYHKKLFGGTILDVGCGNGVLTCFLARQLPGARVVGVDLRPAAVDQARRLAERLNIRNVEFRQASAAQLAGETYDTVFSSRTLRENLTGETVDEMLLLSTQAERTAAGLSGYVAELAALIAPGGSLISFEQGGRTPQLLGWLYALGDCGLAPMEQVQKELLCQAADKEKTEISVTVAPRGAGMSREEVYRLFTAPFIPMMKQNKYVMEGMNAAVYLQNTLGELIEGYNVYFEDGTKAARMALWTDKGDPTVLLSEQQAVGSVNKLFLSLTEKQEAEVKEMRSDIHNFLRRGMTARYLTYENGQEGETDLPEDVK